MFRIAFVCVVLLVGSTCALEPAGVFLIVNKNVPESRELADYYAKARAVPVANIVTIDLPVGEDISRADYDAKLVKPLREALRDRKSAVKCLVCMYGVPLRVGGASPTAEERAEIDKLRPQIEEAEAELKKVEADLKVINDKKDPAPEPRKEAQEKVDRARRKLNPLNQKRQFLQHAESQAAVDSELMLLWWEKYELRRWQVNLNHFQATEKSREDKPPVLLACRLDGPTPAIVRRMIDDAIETEKVGLQGKAYIDARGIRFDPKGTDTGHGYGGYDESMRETASLLKAGGIDAVLDDKPDLFAVESCKEAAIYCGWYSHANFIDSCRFNRGAVAWHLASSEAVSLRRPGAKYWCKNLLEKGACATLGPVAEPYTIGFPKPAEFFGFLATGKYTLAESYGKTVLFASWMGTLIGDPLYNPYAKTPKVREADVVPSPKAGKSPFGPAK